MTTNTDVLIAILQGDQCGLCDGADALDETSSTAASEMTWRRRPKHFIASNDLPFTQFRIHVRAIELVEDTEAHATDAIKDEGEVSAVRLRGQIFYLGEALTPPVHSAVCERGTRYVGQPPEPSVTSAHPDTRTDEMVAVYAQQEGEDGNVPSVHRCAPSSVPPTRSARGIVSHHVWLLEEWLAFPISLSDLPLDAEVRCTVLVPAPLSPGSALAWVTRGTASVFPFSLSGELRTGSHAFALHQSTKISENGQGLPPSSLAPERLLPAAQDRAAQALRTGRLQSIPWLDLVTEQHMNQTYRQVPSSLASLSCAARGGDDNDRALAVGHMHIAFPLASNRLPICQMPLLVDGPALAVGANSTPTLSQTQRRAALAAPCDALTSTVFRPFLDRYAEVRHHDWSESAATLHVRSLLVTYNTAALPDYKDRQRLSLLPQRPPVQLEALRVQDAALLWQYREFIRQDARYFLPFMRSVAWRTSSTERRVAEALIPRWKPIGFADVLACLSCEFHTVRPIRQHAVRLLARESNTRLTQFAVPLLQAMVLDDPAERELGSFLIRRCLDSWELCSALFWASTVEATEEHHIVSARSPAAASASPSPGATTVVGPFTAWRDRQQRTLLQHQPYFVTLLRQQQRAQRWLHALAAKVQKAGGDRTLKNGVGQRLLEKKGCGLKTLFDRHEQGRGGSVGQGGVDGAAAAFTPGASTSSVASSSSAPPPPPQQREMVASAAIAAHALPYAPVTLPTHPAVSIHGVVPQSFFMFKSATLPFRVSLFSSRLTWSSQGLESTVQRSSDAAGHAHDHSDSPNSSEDLASMVRRPLAMPPEVRRHALPSAGQVVRKGTLDTLDSTTSTVDGTAAGSPTPVTFPMAVMYKWNDDVRQDQLVMQLIHLIDTVLRQDGLDLCLTPYSVVATGPREGIIEIVPDVVTFQSVQKDVRGYLRRFHRTADALERAMERYTQSFAGYSIITFVLGIGDRHLENILLTQDGRLLHIDFAYMLGYDPKPFAPPMKIKAEMIEALGGPQSRGYHAFRSYCCSAYHTLRKHASLLLYTLQLMVYANGMPQLTGSARPLADEPLLTPSMRVRREGDGGGANGGRRHGDPGSGGGASAADRGSSATARTVGAPAFVDPRVSVLRVQEKLRLDLTNAQATQFLQNVMADSVGSLFTNLWDTLHAAAQATRA